MNLKKYMIAFIAISLVGCNTNQKKQISEKTNTYQNIIVVGAMKNVMWKGELGSKILLDTIENKEGLYGLGPESYLKGELLINNGVSYVSKVTSDATMTVERKSNLHAPFFVLGTVHSWKEIDIPAAIRSIKDLESYIDQVTPDYKRPFAFKLKGTIKSAQIHVQNLPDGTKVSSPAEAHQGQVNYELWNEQVEIVGFFSTEHKGIFTHHDSYLHMHLITANEKMMGHLDKLEINSMKLYLPVN